MSDIFDPYHRWLGIAAKDQPPNHYRLLAIDRFEADSEVIRDAAEQRIAHVRTYQLGQHAALSQKILNELAAAKACLLDPAQKAVYDLQLSTQMPGRSPARSVPGQGGKTLRSWLPQAGLGSLIAAAAAGLALVVVVWIVAGRGAREPAVAVGQARPRETPHPQPVLSQPAAASQPTATTVLPPPAPVAIDSPPMPVPSTLAPAPETAEPKPEEPPRGAAVYTVAIDPAEATLRVHNDKGTVFGSGQQRTVTIDRPDLYPYVLLIAEHPGFEAQERWLTPVPGEKQELKLTLPPSVPTPAAVSLPAGAALLLTFESETLHVEGETLTLDDLSDFRRSGVVMGAGVVQGKVRDGLLFSHQARVEMQGSFPVGGEPRSLSVWLKDDRGPVTYNVHPVSFGNNRRNKAFGIMQAGGRWRFYDNAGGLDSGVAVDLDWHHHCLTYDGAVLSYYLDGTRVAWADKSLATAPGPLILGASPAKTNFFQGVIDELACYDRALSADEVQQLHQAGMNGRLITGEAAASPSQ